MGRPRWQKVAVAAGGIAAAYAVERLTIGRARRAVDPAVLESFRLPEGTTFRYVDTSDGGVVRVAEVGSGPPLVLLHGVTHAAEVWSWQLADLSARHRVIALDHRGHGESTPGRDPWSVARLADDVAEVIDQLELRGAMVVGHSLGGIVAQQLMLDHPELAPERVRAIALLATTPGGLNILPATWAGMSRAAVGTARRGLAVAGRVQPRLLAANDLSWAMFRFGLGVGADSTHVELTRRLTAATPFSTLAELLEDVVGFDVRDRLHEITVPALVVAGTRDLVTPIRDSRLLAERIPQARLEALPGCGHMVMLERRTAVSDLLTRFAIEVGAGEDAA